MWCDPPAAKTNRQVKSDCKRGGCRAGLPGCECLRDSV